MARPKVEGRSSPHIPGGPAALAVVVAGAFLFAASAAHAFTIDTVVTRGCHEEMTESALRLVRAELSTAGALPASRDERALIADLPFSVPADMQDLGGASLLVGVRDNDLEGQDGNDLSRLALVHGDPRKQLKHCLHGAGMPEPDGTPTALADCRSFILTSLDEALGGLDDTGWPDPALRTTLAVHLALRGQVDAALVTTYVRMGQAIHAVQDGFAHSYRTPDGVGVTAVMNWVDQVNGDFDEARDGPPHTTDLDRCDDPDELRRSRRLAATESTTAILRLALDPSRTRAQKMAALTDLVDARLDYVPGCSSADRWCDAPERAFSENRLAGCDVASSPPATSALAATLVLLTLAARRGRRLGKRLLVTVVLIGAGDAHGEPPASAPGAQAAAAAHVAPPVITPVPEPGPHDRSRPTFGAYLGGGASATDPALAAALGVRLRFNARWTFGVDAEWNPWISINGDNRVRAGALNFYGAAIFRMPLAYEAFNLRVTANIGAAWTLIDLYGVPKGTTGFYGAFYPLGLEWKASRLFYVIINPLGVAAPIPQLRDIPFWYPQYRLSIGLEVYAG